MFGHHQRRRSHGHGRAAHIRNARQLTQLYNDAKVSYENTLANRTSTTSNDDDDPEVAQLRREFQEQQDRLLAWGMHWAEKQSAGSSLKGKEAGFEANIDEKVDQAGLGEIVAGIMQSIKSTLAESGQLQHPGRWKENRGPPAGTTGAWGALKDRMGVASPKPNTDKYKEYELVTGRNLLAKLKESIDLLYSLDEGQEDVAKPKSYAEPSPPPIEHVAPPRLPRSVSATDPVAPKEAARVAHQLISHPLYIDFSRLEPMHDPNAAAEPPSYEEAKENTLPIQPRAVYYLPSMQTYVLVDLVKAKNYPVVEEAMTGTDPFRSTHELSQLISLKGLLTWDSHLKLLGFTLAHGNSRFGLVYALPAPSDPTALQACQTLTTSIQATLEHETSFPPLENKFRLAYNIALASTSYLAHGHCHGHIKSSNIIFLRENDNPKLGLALRRPYVLQPIQKLVGESSMSPSLSHTLYHHADADEVGYGIVPAYDVYSLGLLLLEIGLWRPLSTFWKPKYDRAFFHEKLKRQCIPKLASKCGTRYMKLVQACFDAPEQLQDKPSPFDAAEYLLEIVEDLGKCCALDEAGPPSELDIETFESMIESQRMDQQQPSSKSSAVQQVTAAPIVPAVSTPAKKMSTSSKTKPKPAETLKKWPEMDIPQDHLETWNTMLMPRLSKMLRNALKDSMESCSVSLMMIGSTPEKAKTTICVQCRDTARVRETLCKRFTPKSGWGLVICAADIRRSGQLRKSSKRSNARRSGADSEHIENGVEKPREQLYQPWPGCGASIGAWCDEQHLPPVSFGGTIIVDGQPYGMTVHHMLDDPEDVDRENDQAGPQAPKRSTAPRYSTQTIGLEGNLRLTATEEDTMDDMDIYDEDELADTSDDEDMSDAGSEASTIRPDYVIMDGEGEEFFIMEDSDDDEEPPDLEDDDEGHSSEDTDEEGVETGSIGDTPSISADRLDDEDFCITQPAWDDVPENFFSDDPEYRDEEHLMSHSFGYVHASSGLKRMTKNNVKHEVDWALIKINERRLNLVVNPEAAGLPSRKASRSSKRRARLSLSGAAFTEPPLTAITPIAYLPRLQVSCTGRSSGRKVGRISPAMSLLKLPGRQSFSASFTVEGGMGVPGDSGAWVYSEERRELCGHILAWSDALNMAYISPMEVLFDDLKERLHAKEVRLPAQSPQTSSVDIIPELVQQESSSTIESTKKGKSNVADSMENISTIQLAGKLSGLQINTMSAVEARERARTTSRPSSKASHRDESSPMSAGSAAARRSRAETIPRTQSPTQLPTPPIDSKCARKDIYEFGMTSVRKGMHAGKAVPS